MSESVPRLFVYGTLAPGKLNHHVVEDLGGDWCAAQLRGRLHASGWGADHGCPGLVLDDSGELVSGHLLHSELLPEHWARLDAFEGSEYERIRTTVSTGTGEVLEAFVYVLRDHS